MEQVVQPAIEVQNNPGQEGQTGQISQGSVPSGCEEASQYNQQGGTQFFQAPGTVWQGQANVPSQGQQTVQAPGGIPGYQYVPGQLTMPQQQPMPQQQVYTHPGYASYQVPGQPMGAMPGYFAMPGAGQFASEAAASPQDNAAVSSGQAPQDRELKHDENKYGQLFGMVNDAVNGSPDVSKFMRFFQESGTDFWKGALVGAGVALLLTNDNLKSVLSGSIAGLFGGKKESESCLEEQE